MPIKYALLIVAVLAFASLILTLVRAVNVPAVNTNSSVFSNNGFVRGGMPITYVFNITNNDSSSYDEIRITLPFNNVTYVSCTAPTVDWTCTPNSPTVNTTSFTTVVDTIAAGSSKLFNISATTASQTGNITWQTRSVFGGSIVSISNFQTGLDSSGPASYAAGINTYSENSWVNGSSALTLNCIGAADSSAGVNSTGYTFLFYNKSASANVIVGQGNSSSIIWTSPLGFEQAGFNISCNATDLVQNSGALDYAFYTGFDSKVPAIFGAEVNDSDRIVKSGWKLNLTVNASDTFTVNVTVGNSSHVLMSAVSLDAVLGNYSNWVSNASALCSDVGTNKENPCLLTFRIYDNASQTNTTTLLLYVDDQPPRINANYTNLTAGIARSGSSVNFTVNTTDQNISSVSLIGTAGSNISFMGVFATSGTSNVWYITNKTSDICFAIGSGPCTVKVNATDIAGNWNDTASLIIQIDDILPNVTNPLASDTVINQSQLVDVNVSAVDNVVSVKIMNFSGTPSSTMILQASGLYNITVNATTLCGIMAGICTLKFNATDGAGNWNDTTI
ncbi:MAG TPA: hypothetical protein VI894_01360, partial [Candidatus Nanoarchaeia archaeon]|nr:hypothetical protein [Candidatus Nanoarchaeia archaeon]